MSQDLDQALGALAKNQTKSLLLGNLHSRGRRHTIKNLKKKATYQVLEENSNTVTTTCDCMPTLD